MGHRWNSTTYNELQQISIEKDEEKLSAKKDPVDASATPSPFGGKFKCSAHEVETQQM